MKKALLLLTMILAAIQGGAISLTRVSVHDPSVVYEPTSKLYYIFGTHRGLARSKDMMVWSSTTYSFGLANEAGKVTTTLTSTGKDFSKFFKTNMTKTLTIGGEEKTFGNFDVYAWSAAAANNYDIVGNMWAPDIIYNEKMKKWCLYFSINGDSWASSIVLLTADKITGPYVYQGPVVFSGFGNTSNANLSYKKTDLELVLGEQKSLPSRYNLGSKWGNRFPNCIDPCVFFDEDGKLWMTYGSWSGGIWMLELDENTGLRDYDVTYTLTGSGDGVTVDPYFGKKIAGGYYVSGEASYIEYIGGYYFLFMTYGGLAAGGNPSDYNNGGYQMRVFRSSNPDGPYLDSKNSAAIFSSYQLNFGAKENDGNRGVNIFGAYSNWGNLLTGGANEASGERSQGHNSIIAAEDGRTYLVYHTRFQNWGEGHQVRVHQVFQNEDGWLVAAPFEYTGERIKSAHISAKQKIATDKIPGKYKVLVHSYKLDHTTKAYNTPKEVTLSSDGTISGGYSGSWSIKAGTSYITIKLGSDEYKGVMIEQTLEPKNDKAPCFTALRSATGVTVWGYKYAD
jgi:arabinan endo-1,5-alpha-L-arabinosidase